MNVSITTFDNPFSFFCKVVSDKVKEFSVDIDGYERSKKAEVSDLKHGQHVAVWWNGAWTRGVISTETLILIWLIDHGIHLHPDEKTVFMNLPAQYKRLPSRVFQASIHGVTPIDTMLSFSYDCELTTVVSTNWNNGAKERALNLLATASRVVFAPIAVLTTNNNDIVLGDLYLHHGDGYTNIVDELEAKPAFLERNKLNYIQSLSIYYGQSHRKNSACLLKPDLPGFELPTIILTTTIDEYSAICAKHAEPPKHERFELSFNSSEGDSYCSTVVFSPSRPKKKYDVYQLTAAQEEEYAHLYTVLRGTEYNVLELVRQKLDDFRMCDKYKNAKKGLGRANSRAKHRIVKKIVPRVNLWLE